MKSTSERRLEFEYLISSAELDIHQNPGWYNVKVALFAMLGYAVILGMLLLLIALLSGIGWAAMAGKTIIVLLFTKKIIFVVFGMIYVLIRALWVKFSSPKGYELTAKDYPAFFKELKFLTKQLATPPIHQVILTPEYNAGILQTPRLGIFGWYKNTLFLGLELLMSMSPEQARSVVAHELGHLSGKHSRFSGWIYRIRISWDRIMQSLDHEDNIGFNLLRWFFDWYAPKFAAYSFALARENEYQADRIAASLTSKQATASALVNSHIVHDYLSEHYWQPFFKSADEVPRPATSPYKQLQSFLLNNTFDADVMNSQIRQAMTIKTNFVDTHPSLRDRLEALDCEVSPLEPIKQSAAIYWLREKLPDVISDFDREWFKKNAAKWQERFQYVKQAKDKLTTLKTKDLHQLNQDELWQFANLTEEFHPNVDSLPIYQLYRQQKPDNAHADFTVARLLLDRNDETGVELMKQVLNKDCYLKLDACEWLIHFYKKRNDGIAVRFWQKQADQQMDIERAANKERQIITVNDHFIKPARPSEVEKQFAKQIKTIKGINHAWFSEKRMQHFPDSKTYIVIIEKAVFEQETKLIRQVFSVLGNEYNLFVLEKNGEYNDIAQKALNNCLMLF